MTKRAVEEENQRRFDLWWDSWIEPLLAEVEKKDRGTNRKGGAE